MRDPITALILVATTAVGSALAGEAPAQKGEAKTETQRQIEEALQKRVTLNFADTPARDVLAFLRDTTGVAFIIDDAREDEPYITFKCREMKLALVLKFMLKRAELTHEVGKSAIYVATPERMAEVAETEKGLSLETQRTKEALAKPVSLDFGYTPLQDACDFLGDVTGLNFILDAKGDPMLTLRVRQMPIRDCLVYIARLTRLRVYAEDNVIVFTDEPKPKKE